MQAKLEEVHVFLLGRSSVLNTSKRTATILKAGNQPDSVARYSEVSEAFSSTCQS